MKPPPRSFKVTGNVWTAESVRSLLQKTPMHGEVVTSTSARPQRPICSASTLGVTDRSVWCECLRRCRLRRRHVYRKEASTCVYAYMCVIAWLVRHPSGRAAAAGAATTACTYTAHARTHAATAPRWIQRQSRAPGDDDDDDSFSRRDNDRRSIDGDTQPASQSAIRLQL